MRSASRATRDMKPQAALKSLNFKSRAMASRSPSGRQDGSAASSASRSPGESFCTVVDLALRLGGDSRMTSNTTFGPPPSAEDIADLADRALAAIPERLRRRVAGVAILVEDMPDDET